MPTPKEVVIEFNSQVIEQGNQCIERFFDPDFMNHSAPTEMDTGATGIFQFLNNILRPALSNLQVDILQQACEENVVFTHKRFTCQHTGALFGIEPTQKFISF
ncbi:ester cyclase [Teredinibacter turnerae]|uniref:ester cyclase n=1 Tax=Teredinibacter turnerae TaxID=2426 RepID=UPI0006966417|nr:ester cyclase [Teredinibacter turnerae]